MIRRARWRGRRWAAWSSTDGVSQRPLSAPTAGGLFEPHLAAKTSVEFKKYGHPRFKLVGSMASPEAVGDEVICVARNNAVMAMFEQIIPLPRDRS